MKHPGPTWKPCTYSISISIKMYGHVCLLTTIISGTWLYHLSIIIVFTNPQGIIVDLSCRCPLPLSGCAVMVRPSDTLAKTARMKLKIIYSLTHSFYFLKGGKPSRTLLCFSTKWVALRWLLCTSVYRWRKCNVVPKAPAPTNWIPLSAKKRKKDIIDSFSPLWSIH